MSEQIGDLNFQEIEKRIRKAISILESKDLGLFRPLGSERNISQRFAKWLENEFPEWNVDCEYNLIVDNLNRTAKSKVVDLMKRRGRRGFIDLEEPKEIKVTPDIIIHRRATKENLLAIEVKTTNDQEEIEFDKIKLRAYCEYAPLNYRYALFVRFQEPQMEGQIVAELSFITRD